MSSATSTEKVRLRPDAAAERPTTNDQRLQPWQFFVLAALGCATAVTFIARGQGVTVVVLLGVLLATAALVGLAALRMLRPLVGPEDDRTVMIGQRTRAALEREKLRTGYRDQIERDLGKRLGDHIRRGAKTASERACAQCATTNDQDARFCKNCGAKL
ncbi:MAG: zinc ribbon domain-containing protein [Acidobacteria bacterium]|nr:zinc ribbon domain-containing protein [Acidobacteriota bacterium]